MYSERIVIYMDILGFKEIVSNEAFERVNKVYGKFNEMILNSNDTFVGRVNLFAQSLARRNNSPFERIIFNKEDADLVFFSDCVVWSYPVDKLPKVDFIFVLLAICSAIDILLGVLFHEGILIRGGVSIGSLYVNKSKVFGSGLMRAYELEQLAQYPRVVFGSELIDRLSDKRLYKAFLKHKLCYNPKGFYAHNYFDQLRLLQAAEGILHDKGDRRMEEMLWNTWYDPIASLIERGLKIEERRIRAKYEWLNAKIEPYRKHKG